MERGDLLKLAGTGMMVGLTSKKSFEALAFRDAIQDTGTLLRSAS